MGNVSKSWKQGSGASGCASCGRKAQQPIVTKGAKVIGRSAKPPVIGSPEGAVKLSDFKMQKNAPIGEMEVETTLLNADSIDWSKGESEELAMADAFGNFEPNEPEIPFGVVTLEDAENEDIETIDPPKKGRRKTRQ